MFLLFSLFIAHAQAHSEAMPSMPVLKPVRVYTVQGKEDWEKIRGFGDKEPHVRMMNLMMVEGSGMEGMEMDMSDHDMDSHE